MISFGNNIRQANDKLQKVELNRVAHSIINPKSDMRTYIDQLRQVASINPKQYRQLKINLPYFVAAIFNPPYRKMENFAHTRYFILDIDHLADKELNINDLMEKFKKDDRIVLAFRSPSNDGVKIFFKFDKPLYDAGKYSFFYKVFAHRFSKDYHLEQYIDKRTSDVSRACFYSYDLNAIYKPEAIPVKIENTLDFNDEYQINIIQKEIETNNPDKFRFDDDQFLKQELPLNIIENIRKKLNPKIEVKKSRKIIVPEPLNKVMDDIQAAVAEFDIEVQSVKNINYGKQIRFGIKHLWTEINLFYGSKKGFSIVESTKTGSNEELGHTIALILSTLLNGGK